MARKKSFSIYIVAFLLFAGGLGYMVWSGLSSGSMLSLNVREALAMPATQIGSARLFGTVGEENNRAENGLGVRFTLLDLDVAGKSMLVDYKGVVPDTFAPGAEVILTGGMGPDGAFHAKSLMTKCPSKYEKENRPAPADV